MNELEQDPLLQGLPFLNGESKRLSVASLASKMLCERHNQALSPLDAEALNAFRALRQFETNYRDGESVPDFDALLVSGPRLEAWLLKTAFGFLAAGLVELEGTKVAVWRDNADKLLLNVLFGDQVLPESWGLWLVPPEGPQAAAADIAAQTRGEDGQLWSLTVEFGAFPITLALGRPGGKPIYRPSGLVVLKDGAQEAQQTLLVGWPPGTAGEPAITTRVGQMDDWDKSR